MKSHGTSKEFFYSIVGCSTSRECCWLGLVEHFFSIMPVGHKLNNKANLESLVQLNQTFTLYMKTTTTFNL